MSLLFREERANWVKILEEMYEYKMAIGPDYQLAEDIDLENPIFIDQLIKLNTLADNLNLEITDLEDSINFLKSAGLVREYESDDGSSFGLNQEGLQLAHQIKTERQRRNTNLILVALTAILAIPLLVDVIRWICGVV
ncbi:hypothetical protein [Halopenitus sp. POP-27]|uniref:hypothetical protein n=1 Tax=Halopenitus sp. POP-27 TaxID=2994425 RepID=UPI0024688DD8|nr:hypothetical protein [Halopenitus sp. POP-27]